MKVSNLICNTQCTPLGVETLRPQLSWALQADDRNAAQSGYQILAASSRDALAQDIGDLWDTGKVRSAQSLHIGYEGSTLESRQAVYWKVRVWDGGDRPSAWSEPEKFEMGILSDEEWVGQWIGSPDGRTEVGRSVPAPYFRKAIQVPSAVVRARLYWSGLGFSEVSVNGQRVGDAVLAPGFTRYDETVLYQTADIGPLLTVGDNVIGVLLGNGWYNSFTQEVWDFRQAAWRDQPKLLLEAHITLVDGTEMVIATGPDWTTASSPILFDGLRNGEFYDARRERVGWDRPGSEGEDWQPAKIVRSPGGRLRSEQMPPIMVTQTLPAVSMHPGEAGSWIFDVGQNLSGWARIELQEPEGTEVTLRYAEDLDAQGRLDTSHIDIFVKSGAFQTDQYIAKGEGQEVWEPRFVYHGFRYVEVRGLSHPPTLGTVKARVVHTALESRGEFQCSNALLNQIQQAARWSTLTNYHSIPTDCPHREKNGWTGDAALSAEQVLLNFNPTTAYFKWMQDLRDVQRPSGQIPGIVPTGGWGYNWGSGPAWDSALFLIPWYVYLYEGNTLLLEQMYPAMAAYLRYAESMANHYLVDFGLGDWCPPTGGPAGHACPTAVTDTAYFYVMADVMAKTARVLGRRDDEGRYEALAEAIRNAFRQAFLDSASGRVVGDCQTSQACVLYQKLVNSDETERVLARLVEHVESKDRHLDAGILGAKYVMHSLTELGLVDLTYAMATQTTFPSWGHWLEQGATTLWEQWDGEGSHNHHMFSDISAWFYQGLAGIQADPGKPGYQHILLRPQPVPGLEWVRAWHESLYGRIECNWRTEGQRFTAEVRVPVNCQATLTLPRGYTEGLQEGGAEPVGITVQEEGDQITVAMGSGDYRFTIDLSPRVGIG